VAHVHEEEELEKAGKNLGQNCPHHRLSWGDFRPILAQKKSSGYQHNAVTLAFIIQIAMIKISNNDNNSSSSSNKHDLGSAQGTAAVTHDHCPDDMSSTPPSKLDLHNVLSQSVVETALSRRGTIYLTKSFDIATLFLNSTQPSKSTTRSSTITTASTNVKFFVSKFVPLMMVNSSSSSSSVHHLSVYLCSQSQALPFVQAKASFRSRILRSCQGIIYSWSRGRGDFCLPPGVAFFLDPTVSHRSHVVIETHFNINGRHDNSTATSSIYSGISLHGAFTDELGTNEEPIMMSHLFITSQDHSMALALPPGKPYLHANGSCLLKPLFPQFDASNNQIFPPVKLRIYAVAAHSHSHCRKVWTTATNPQLGTRMLQCGAFTHEIQSYQIVHDQFLYMSTNDDVTVHCLFDTMQETKAFSPDQTAKAKCAR